MAAKHSEGERELRRREALERRRAGQPAGRAEETRSLPNSTLLVPAFAGMLVAGHLALVALGGATPVACGAGSDCDVVQTSRFSVVLGVPVAIWGFAAYAILAVAAARVRWPWWRCVRARGRQSQDGVSTP